MADDEQMNRSTSAIWVTARQPPKKRQPQPPPPTRPAVPLLSLPEKMAASDPKYDAGVKSCMPKNATLPGKKGALSLPVIEPDGEQGKAASPRKKTTGLLSLPTIEPSAEQEVKVPAKTGKTLMKPKETPPPKIQEEVNKMSRMRMPKDEQQQKQEPSKKQKEELPAGLSKKQKTDKKEGQSKKHKGDKMKTTKDEEYSKKHRKVDVSLNQQSKNPLPSKKQTKDEGQSKKQRKPDESKLSKKESKKSKKSEKTVPVEETPSKQSKTTPKPKGFFAVFIDVVKKNKKMAIIGVSAVVVVLVIVVAVVVGVSVSGNVEAEPVTKMVDDTKGRGKRAVEDKLSSDLNFSFMTLSRSNNDMNNNNNPSTNNVNEFMLAVGMKPNT